MKVELVQLGVERCGTAAAAAAAAGISGSVKAVQGVVERCGGVGSWDREVETLVYGWWMGGWEGKGLDYGWFQELEGYFCKINTDKCQHKEKPPMLQMLWCFQSGVAFKQP